MPTPTEILLDLHRNVMRSLQPEPMYVYKPRPDGSGTALKANLRLVPEFATADDGKEFVRNVDGGLFLELVPQIGKTQDGKHATFGWTDPRAIRVKVGLADQLALLTAMREVRSRGKAVPAMLRPKLRTDNPSEEDLKRQATTVALFHRFGGSSTAINYQFSVDSSTLSVSKSADLRRQVTFTLMDEVMFERYLQLGLDAYVRWGAR